MSFYTSGKDPYIIYYSIGYKEDKLEFHLSTDSQEWTNFAATQTDGLDNMYTVYSPDKSIIYTFKYPNTDKIAIMTPGALDNRVTQIQLTPIALINLPNGLQVFSREEKPQTIIKVVQIDSSGEEDSFEDQISNAAKNVKPLCFYPGFTMQTLGLFSFALGAAVVATACILLSGVTFGVSLGFGIALGVAAIGFFGLGTAQYACRDMDMRTKELCGLEAIL